MILRFRIPNGQMAIDLEVFITKAGARRVKKMIRMYRESCPDSANIREVRGFLMELAQICQEAVEENRSKRNQAAEEVQTAERVYRWCSDHLKEVPSGLKTEWREKLKQVRENQKDAKEKLKACERKLAQAERDRKACVEAIAVFNTEFEGWT